MRPLKLELEAFGPLFGAFGGGHYLEADGGEGDVGGEFGGHRGGESGGFLEGGSLVGRYGESNGANALLGAAAILPNLPAESGGLGAAAGAFEGGGEAVAGRVGEGVFRKEIEKLAAGGDDVFVPGGGCVAMHEFEHDLGAARMFGLGTGEFGGGADESEDLFVDPVEVDELEHEGGASGGGLGGFLQLGFEGDRFVNRGC